MCYVRVIGNGLREGMMSLIFHKATTLFHCKIAKKGISLDLHCYLFFIIVLFKKMTLFCLLLIGVYCYFCLILAAKSHVSISKHLFSKWSLYCSKFFQNVVIFFTTFKMSPLP